MKKGVAQAISSEAAAIIEHFPVAWLNLSPRDRLPPMTDSPDLVCLDPVTIGVATWRYRPTRALVKLCLDRGETLTAMLYGTSEDIECKLEHARRERLLWHGSCSWFAGDAWLKQVTLHARSRAHTLCPRYGRGVQPPLQGRIGKLCAEAAQYLAVHTPGDNAGLGERITVALQTIHAPQTHQALITADTWLTRYAAHRVAADLLTAECTWASHRGAPRLTRSVMDYRAQGIAATAEQQRAIGEILNALTSTQRMHRVLVGDVGSGKTLVFATVAATAVKAGWRAGVIAPSRILAEQSAAVIARWYPDLNVCLGALPKRSAPAAIYVGTTELLSGASPDLLIVDEQHRFSATQRESLTMGGAHLLEASATLIPRTHALIEAGLVAQTVLAGTPLERDIRTRWVSHEERGSVLEGMQTVFAADSEAQALIVYPAREHAAESRRSAIAAFRDWKRVGWVTPDAVRLIHAGLDDNQAIAALAAMRAGEARILVSTVITENGIDLPGVRVVVIVGAERFGLAQLHQIRGRVARRGGRGYCLLITGPRLKQKAVDRLTAFCATRTGEEIAALDRTLRGGGDLGAGAQVQHGADIDSPIPAIRLGTDEIINAVVERRSHANWNGG